MTGEGEEKKGNKKKNKTFFKIIFTHLKNVLTV